jgi:tRNA threonylcarbamoyladenosine biosynthesis protein TsaE
VSEARPTGENVHVFTTHSAEATIETGRELARFLEPPKVVLLRGDLGAGKTTLVKGIAAALGAAEPEEVTSPTFTLIHEYAGRSVEQPNLGESILLYHLDLYRIENQRQLDTLGMEELMTPQSVLLIEWGEKFPSVAARSDGEIVIETLHGDQRRITLALRSQAGAPSRRGEVG